jgi:glucose/mannose-6-phosphate isomerase
MMTDAIRAFPGQFTFLPVVENRKKLKKCRRAVLLGMGGSHLAADLALAAKPDLPLAVWSDYGLPPGDLRQTLIIANSYSGNTEETIDGLRIAMKKGLPAACIAVGGKLLDIAKKKKLPYIEIPNTGIQPRSALGFSLRALLAILGDAKGLAETKRLAAALKPDALLPQGKTLAAMLQDRVPVVYASRANTAIAYNWKIKFNETGKIPAFYNCLPELNHNEMTGFDATPRSRHLSETYFFIMLRDRSDHPRVQKRMAVLEKLYRDRGLDLVVLDFVGKTRFEKIFTSLLLADWAAAAIADRYGLESEQVPMVEEFKKLIVG